MSKKLVSVDLTSDHRDELVFLFTGDCGSSLFKCISVDI